MATKFLKYKAVRDIALGSTSTQISAGQVVEFDGEMLKVGSTTQPYPQVRSAIKLGWFEPYGKGHSAKSEVVEPVPTVKKAFSTIESDQVEVSTVVKSLQKTKDASAPKTKAATVAPPTKKVATPVSKAASKFVVERKNDNATPIGVLGEGGKVKYASKPKPKPVIPASEVAEYAAKTRPAKVVEEEEPDVEIDLSDVTPPTKAKKAKKAAPEVEWDKSRSPQVRIKDAITLYKNDPASLKQVLAMEDKGVAAQIKQKMAKLQAK